MTGEPSPPVQPFPRVFLVANGIELLERLAYYGVYVNLSLYLIDSVGMTPVEMGALLGVFALARSWLPVGIGALADRITFRISLMAAFSLYALAYLALFFAPSRGAVSAALFGMAVGGAFMKPVITGCVRRYSPPGRQATGFAVFYAIVNAGSVVGKVLAKNVREAIGLRYTILTSVAASVLALLTTIALFFEPKEEAPPATQTSGEPARGNALVETLRDYGRALSEPRLTIFLALVSGYYLLIEQFYQTFPVYMKRVLPSAPMEYITLVNPLSIALLQLLVARAARSLDSLGAMTTGILIGAVSMATMGLYPNLYGAVGSFFIFAIAEMVFSPRYYDYVSSFAPRGKEGLYMGLALVPSGVGGLAGGILSGRLIERFLPVAGPPQPMSVWGTYAIIGGVCATLLLVYRLWAAPPRTASPG